MGQRLTQEQIDGMCRMRAEGYAAKEIAAEYRCSLQTVLRRAPYYPYARAVPVIYPALDRWMKDNRLSIAAFARIVGIPAQTLRSNLVGEHTIVKTTIDKILAATGLTYEEAFREEERE